MLLYLSHGHVGTDYGSSAIRKAGGHSAYVQRNLFSDSHIELMNNDLFGDKSKKISIKDIEP